MLNLFENFIMTTLIRILALLIILIFQNASCAIPREAIIPLLINDKLSLPSGWITTSLTGSQMNGYGTYDSTHLYIPTPMYFSNNMNLSINYGLSDTLDFLISLYYVQNKSSLRNYNYIGDTSITLGYDIVGAAQKNTKLRLELSLLIPTGKYNHLKENLFTTDATGAGSYQPSIGFSFSHDFAVIPEHKLTLYSNSGLTYTYKVPLNGISAYGGTDSTIGSIRPGNALNFLIGTTYAVTQKLSASLEYSIYAAQPSTFKGIISDDLEEYIKYRLSAFNSTKPGEGYLRPRILFNFVLPTIRNIGGDNFLGSGSVAMLSMTPSISYKLENDYNLTFSMSVSTPGGKNTTAFYKPSLTLTKTISSS